MGITLYNHQIRYLNRAGFCYPAEIVPLANPYSASVGDKLTVLCLVDGKPVVNQPVIAGSQGADGAIAEQAGRTDGSGKIRFTIDRAKLVFPEPVPPARPISTDIMRRRLVLSRD